jgi:periplasmic protein TonB
MAAPLRSENPEQQKSLQFAHFGVLNPGAQNRTSTVTSLVLNLAVAFVVIVVTAATKRTIDKNKMLTDLVAPVTVKKVEPIKPPKIVPPKVKITEIPKIEPPKIAVVKLPELPKQPVVQMDTPKPIITPPAPQKVVAPAAPVQVSLAHPQAASVPNNDAHPTAVRLGASDSPIKNLTGPAVAPVNMGRGMPGMNAANTGNGPAATKVVLGNGSPGGTSTRGNGVVAVAGIPHGVPGGTGTGKAVGGQQVSLGQTPQPVTVKPTVTTASVAHTAPKVLYKPKPDYTQEAIDKHVEGVVSVQIRVLPNGSVEVVGVTKPLGYGLDDSARRAIMATKFQPATDASGAPIVWEGVVNVTFQLAG